MNSSAERIRQRFLHRIGIPPQQPTAHPSQAVQTSCGDQRAVQSATELSCLGTVKTSFEPLKVGLDDDSSFEDDESCDDDFYFGDDQLPTEMDVDNFLSNSKNETLKKMFSMEKKKPQMGENLNKLHQQSLENAPVLDAVNVVSDHGSTSSSLDGISTNSSLTAPCFSAGNLTFLSNESYSESRGIKRSRGRRKVSLQNHVVVIPIPMRGEYPDRVKERLWSSASELYENAIRNSIEFASEGWNWRTAVEDDNMIVDNSSGDLIHPIHLHNLLQLDTNHQTKGNVEQISNIQDR